MRTLFLGQATLWLKDLWDPGEIILQLGEVSLEIKGNINLQWLKFRFSSFNDLTLPILDIHCLLFFSPFFPSWQITALQRIKWSVLKAILFSCQSTKSDHCWVMRHTLQRLIMLPPQHSQSLPSLGVKGHARFQTHGLCMLWLTCLLF